MGTSTKRPLMKSAEAAEFLGISLETLRKLRSEGEIPVYKVGSHPRFRPEDLEEYLERVRVKAVA